MEKPVMLNTHLTNRTFVFAKDLNGRFLFCNEDHAEIAGLDSPSQIVGKSDVDLFWKKNASECQMSDRLTIKCGSRANVLERCFHRYDGVFDIIISKYQLQNEKGECIGVVGSYYDVKKHLNDNIPEHCKIPTKQSSDSIYLSKREKEVLNYLALGRTNKEVAYCLEISPRTVDFFVNQLKKKFQCAYKKDVVISAVKLGLIDVSLMFN